METVLNPGIKSNFLPPPFLPYTYQVPIIKDMTKVILEGKSGLVIQPTATGKSVEAAFTARACILLHNMKGLYLYNENEGIEQARIKFAEVFAGNNILCGNFFGYGRDEFVYRADMVFASFQSLNSHHGKWYTTFDKNHFGFVIVNEAHHGQAETYKEVIQHFECGKIGMTATEKRMDGKDIEELFPHIICEIRLEKAIANQWVCPLEYLTLANGISEYRLKKICHDILKKGKRVSLRQLNETIFIESLDREILKEVYAYALPINEKSRQTLFFCENINHANHVLRLLQKDGMSAEAIHSKLPSQKNRSVMKRFRNGEIQFLLSVDKLNEDIDLPNVEVGVFLRATSSENIFLQQLGRLLRKTPQKEKAYVLDFVGNVERIVMVQQLQEKVERFYLKDKVSAPKDLIHIKGYGFKFMFDRQFKNILEVLRVIREGAYPTWKEASDVIIKAGIITSTQYLRRYKTIDLRLPADPSKVYKDFPGWDVFLNKQTSPNAWKTAFEISQKVKIGKKIIITFVKREYENNKSWVKKYWRQGQYIEHYHPSLVAIIKRKFSKKKDWLLLEEAVNLIGVGRYKVLRTAKLLQVQYPNEMAEFFTQGLDYPSWQFNPTFVEKIKEELNKVQSPPLGWRTATSLRRDTTLVVSFETIIVFVSSFRESNPEWFMYYNAVGKNAEFYHPELVQKIHEQYGEKIRQLAPDGWKTPSQIAKNETILGKAQTIKKYAEQFRLEHSKWFESFWLESNFFEHYHPELVSKIIEDFAERKYAPVNCFTPDVLAKSFGIKPLRVIQYAGKFRDGNPEWFKFYMTKGNNYIEHYSPELVVLIQTEFNKKELAPKGWMSLSEIAQIEEVEIKTWGLWNPAADFIEDFRESNQKWFRKFWSDNGEIECYHPKLVQKIKEKFAKEKRE